jgi:hypothetical protein
MSLTLIQQPKAAPHRYTGGAAAHFVLERDAHHYPPQLPMCAHRVQRRLSFSRSAAHQNWCSRQPLNYPPGPVQCVERKHTICPGLRNRARRQERCAIVLMLRAERETAELRICKLDGRTFQALKFDEDRRAQPDPHD